MKKQSLWILTAVFTVLTLFAACSICFSPKGNALVTGSNAQGPEDAALQKVNLISQKLFGEELLSGMEGFGGGRKILRTIELHFGEQAWQEGDAVLFSFAHGEKILYQTGIGAASLPAGEPVRLYLNAPIESGEEYTIRLESAIPENGFAVRILPMTAASTTGACETQAGPCDGQLLLSYTFVRPYGKGFRFVLLFLLLVLFSGALCILWDPAACRTRCMKWCSGILGRFCAAPVLCTILSEVLLCVFAVRACGPDLQPAVKAVLYLLSAFSAYYIHTRGYARMRELCRNRAAAGLYILLVLYGAFAFTANRLFISPVSAQWTRRELLSKGILFAAAAFWIAPILAALFVWCSGQYRGAGISGRAAGPSLNRPVRLYAICSLMLLVPLAVMLYAYNPAISAWDTGYCLFWVPDLHGMLNWHPPFYVTILKILLGVWHSLYCLVFAQWLFWLYVWIELLAFLRKRGLSDAVLYLATAVSACSTPALLSLCTLWKDTPYTIALLWVTVIMARLYWDGTENRKKVFIYLELAFSLAFLCLIRQNGIVPYLMTALALLTLCFKNKRILLAVACSALCVWAVLGPYYTFLEITPMEPASKFAGLTQDLMSVYYYGGDVPEEVIDLTNERTGHDVQGFQPGFNASWAGGVYDFPVSTSGFIKMYIRTFVRNPLQLIRTVLYRSNHLWDVFGSSYNFEGNCNYTATAEEVFADVWKTYEKRIPNQLTEKLSILIDLTFENQLLHLLLWRVGPWTLLLLVITAVHLIQQPARQSWLLFIPIAGHIIGIVLSAGWSEHRYYWPVIPITLFILLCIMGRAGAKEPPAQKSSAE